MTKKEFKDSLAINGINIFYFCIVNSFDHNDISLLKDDEEVDTELSSKLKEHIKKINDIEGIFFDVAKSEGLKNKNEKVEFHLEGNNKDISFSFDASMINRIDFII